MSECIVAKRGGRFVDLTGQVFGWLKVIGIDETTTPGRIRWKCLCQCGNNTITGTHELRSGATKSCGCFNRSILRARNFRHGFSKTPEYKAWKQMVQRCTNPKNRNWYKYGARGITICSSWRSFEVFIGDMGWRPTKKHQLDRIDNNGNYCPENCRWVTNQQNSSNRRDTIHIMWNGVDMCAAEFARAIGVTSDYARYRIKRGWSAVEIAFGRK